MYITHLSESWIPGDSANSIQVMRMCQGFVRAGGAVRLYARRGTSAADPFAYYDVPPVFRIAFPLFLRRRGGTWIFAWQAALAAARRHRFHGGFVYARCPVSALLAARWGVPTIFEVHDLAAAGSRMDKVMMPRLLRARGLLGVVAVSRALRDDFAQRYAVAWERTLVAPPGAEVREYAVQLRHSANGRLQVGYMGSFFPGKGMEVCAALVPRCPWADFHFVGGRARDALDRQSWMGEHANVRFHGHVAPQHVHRYMQQCDVLLLPNQPSVLLPHGADIGRHTAPLKMIEYMSTGRAVIASDLAVLREVLQHEVNCLLCPHDSPEAWEQALRRLRDEPGLRERLGATARDQVKAKYTWRGRAERVLQAFHAWSKDAARA